MTLTVIATTETRTKVTCLTCKLKKCVGRCNWSKEPVRRAA
jgi:hypothetical protein